MRTFLSLFLLLSVLYPGVAFSGGKKPPEPPKPTGKRVVGLVPVENVRIEMPDQTGHNFGEDFQASLVTRLIQSGRYLVKDEKLTPAQGRWESKVSDPYIWPGSVTPTATVRIQVEALNFITGSGGDRMFYGFDESFRTPFNSGSEDSYRNEFPLRIISTEPSWFGRSFARKGFPPFDSRSGLDLGDGFNLNILFAWLSVKYARYQSELHLKLYLDTPDGAAPQYRWVEVKGEGFFFDVSGAYEGYSAGISVARKDAMDQALKNAIQGSFDAIDRALMQMPLAAKIDAVLENKKILMGTGPLSEIQAGTLYQIVSAPQVVIEVESSGLSGSVGHVVAGDLSSARPGLLLRQVDSIQAARQTPLVRPLALSGDVPSAVETIRLKEKNLSQTDLSQWVPIISEWEAFLKSLLEQIFLPYRIARYFLYNQDYHSDADLGSTDRFNISREAWAKRIGLDSAPPMAKSSQPIVIAVIDSGVDYNHPILHPFLWMNPHPDQNPNGHADPYGWDFISSDSRPYDDAYHGTQVASLLVTVAPEVRVMPIKVFNPWGITTSAALSGAFQYAVDHGAQIILCAWATGMPSRALQMGVAYARDHGVVVVTAAGDDGMNLSKVPYYPTVFSRSLENVLSVSAVDENDQLVQIAGRNPNWDPASIQIAGPGSQLRVAEPRSGETRETSTGLAAAVVAGVLARNIAFQNLGGTPSEWIGQILGESDRISGLERAVGEGRRVRVRR